MPIGSRFKNRKAPVHAYPPQAPPRGRYHQEHIADKVDCRPWLKALDEFLDPALSNNFGADPSQRLDAFDIKVLCIYSSRAVSNVIHCYGAAQFREERANIQMDQDLQGQIFLVEDLSAAMINTLGAELNVDPEFFANHLEGTQSFRLGPKNKPTSRDPIMLPNELRKAPYYSLSFRRPYHMPSGLEDVVKARKNRVLTRGVQLLGEFSAAFGVEKISVYKKRGDPFAIILTDKLQSEALPPDYMGYPMSLKYDNDPPAPAAPASPTAPDNSRPMTQASAQKTLISWFQRLDRQTARQLLDDNEPIAMSPVLKIVEETTAMFLSHALYYMSRIVTRHCDSEFPDSVPFFLRVSRNLYRHLHNQLKVLRSATLIASLRGGEGLAQQVQDITYLKEDMEKAESALKEDVRFLVAAASIREGNIVGLVSKLAFLFLPVSLLATILGIQDDYTHVRFAILGGLSGPFISISVYVMFFWKPSNLDKLQL